MYELLIADDEVNSRQILSDCFPWEEIGFHICGQFDNGQEALDFVKDNPVHVILTDINMPVLNGVELAKEISHLPSPHPIIVFLSAYEDFHYAQDAIKYGVRYYILKPTNFSELKDIFLTVRNELDKRFHFDSDTDQNEDSDLIIKKVRQYCLEHYRDGSLSDLASSLYLNPSYLSQLIKLKTDRTFSDLINDARMNEAALLLHDHNLKIFNISSMVGYLNPNNFARAFKAYWNMTPSEYRNHEN